MKLLGYNIEIVPREGKNMTPAEKLTTSLHNHKRCEIYISLPEGMDVENDRVEELAQAISQGLLFDSLELPLPEYLTNAAGEPEVQKLRDRLRGQLKMAQKELCEVFTTTTSGVRGELVQVKGEPTPRIVISLPRLPTDKCHNVILILVQPWVTGLVEQVFKEYL